MRVNVEGPMTARPNGFKKTVRYGRPNGGTGKGGRSGNGGVPALDLDLDPDWVPECDNRGRHPAGEKVGRPMMTTQEVSAGRARQREGTERTARCVEGDAVN